MTRTAAMLSVGRRQVPVTNLAKPLYPTGFTKGEVLHYYARIAPAILPHLHGRAVTMKRFPDGATAESFFAKNCPAHRPAWVRTASSLRTGGEPDFCLIDGPAALLWAANLAALELHVPMAKAAQPDRPTAVVFDLDPGPPADLTDCLRLGLELRDLLAEHGLRSFAKTSGGKGLHDYVPLNVPGVTFEQTRSFAKSIALTLEREFPRRVTAVMARAGRRGKVFVDWSQNARHKTTVCVYSLRAGPRSTVSTPIDWDEVAGNARAFFFEPNDVLARVARRGDAYAEVLKLRQRLPAGAHLVGLASQ